MSNLTEVQKERIELWCKALETGGYKQIRGALRTRHGMCCLGVACDVSKLDEWRDKEGVYMSYLGVSSVLPLRVREWYGLKDANPFLHDHTCVTTAVYMNDDPGRSFAEIAAAIRRTYLQQGDAQQNDKM
jgi:hypothetical protein